MTEGVLVLLSAAVLGAYLAGVAGYDRRHLAVPFPRGRAIAFTAGLAVLMAALSAPFDAYAHDLFWMHMLQHLLLTLIAAPLLLLGTPLLLARQAGPPSIRRLLGAIVRHPAVRWLLFPGAGWCLYALVMWGSHYSGLYEAALESPSVHVLEHALYLAAAMLFWFPVVALEPVPWRMPHYARLLYLFTAMPPSALLGLSLYQANRVLYPHYELRALLAGRSPLADQQAGGAAMWIVGGFCLMIAALAVAASWARYETLVAAHADLARDAGEDASRPAQATHSLR